ncbi:acetoin dehydrogenase dihydrolipoyllysine-residue acetyltransferase subunit [Hoeflea alexandrii]|uniref:acetoin dehydrogenase dihydrolipoyllysine-residue acetyltransferase subunit n=1 Tax=Hoeflea alexandrii TaxID=288436 RepID=UPI0022AFFB3B|nr:acetoin dehydrogenase dihydrolipoyllysine-residue acetyltransferase subunit [Hoeflea alexandrii]MCZ4291630.1 acetoin dehydrogenase dihydrolipoyllysine-residue acetyltransferase subunit [Hoeflea alexandrii]
MATPVRVEAAGGEYMENVVVLEWSVEPGATVTAGDTLVTVETAKAATEIPAPVDGFLTAIFAEPGMEVPLSAVLGLIGTTAEDTAFEAKAEAKGATEGALAKPEPIVREQISSAGAASARRIVASPAARVRARSMGIDLRAVRASSPSGRIKLRDLASTQVLDGGPNMSRTPATALPADEAGRLNVIRSGAPGNIPVVMIHGFGADGPSWSPIERDLARQRPVLRLELPNHGKSPRRRMTSFSELAREIAIAFDDLQLPTVHLVGHSLGGACALALADIRPKRIASLALIAPAGLGPRIDGDFIEGFAGASSPVSLGPWLRHMVADPKIIGDDFVRAAMASRADPDQRAAQRQMARDLFPDSTQSFDLRAALERLTCPTRTIWGKADAILPWQQALSVPGEIALHLLATTGHVPHLEKPEVVAKILRDHFASTETRP